MPQTIISFKDFIQQHLPYAIYINIHEHLGTSRKKATMLLNNPNYKIGKLELEKIDELLVNNNGNYLPGEIIKIYNDLQKSIKRQKSK